MDLLPGLNDTGQQDGGADVCTSKLSIVNQVSRGSVPSRTYVAEDDGEETHASNGTDGAGLLNPVVPAVCEYRDPSLCDECLHKDEHAECEG